MSTIAARVVDDILRAINSAPRTPSREHLLEIVHAALDEARPGPVQVVLDGIAVGPQKSGASVVVEPNMSLTLNHWQISSPRPLTGQEVALAVIEWLRMGVATAPRQ